jgi:hypothetical protein
VIDGKLPELLKIIHQQVQRCGYLTLTRGYLAIHDLLKKDFEIRLFLLSHAYEHFLFHIFM